MTRSIECEGGASAEINPKHSSVVQRDNSRISALEQMHEKTIVYALAQYHPLQEGDRHPTFIETSISARGARAVRNMVPQNVRFTSVLCDYVRFPGMYMDQAYSNLAVFCASMKKLGLLQPGCTLVGPARASIVCQFVDRVSFICPRANELYRATDSVGGAQMGGYKNEASLGWHNAGAMPFFKIKIG